MWLEIEKAGTMRITFGSVLAIVLVALAVVSSTVARAGYVTTYTMDLTVPDTISNVLAFDEGANGFNRITGLSDITGPGLVSIVNPLESSEQATGSFLLGLMEVDGAPHVFMTMTPAGVTATANRTFTARTFKEPTLTIAIQNATAGLPSNNTDLIAAYATLNNFSSTFHDYLYSSPDNALTGMRFSTPIMVTVPTPASWAGGLTLIAGLVIWRARRRAVAI